MLVDLPRALALCLDGINNGTNAGWNTCTVGRATVLCSAATGSDLIVTVVILKNVVPFPRAFGENLRGKRLRLFAARSLTVALRSLNKVMESTEVSHEFWFEEATHLATKLDIRCSSWETPQSSAGNLGLS